jgi:hypothetical protein
VHRRLALVLLFATACGPAARSLRPTIAIGPATRTITTLTDLEEVRDAATDGSAVYAATDDGLLVYRGEGAPTRIGRAEGLPSDDVTAVAVDGAGLLVATGGGLARIEGSAVTAIPLPLSGRVTDVAVTGETAWVCSLNGLHRRSGGTWASFGDPFHCTTLAPTPEGQLWAGSDAGVYYVDSDAEGPIVREHGAASGIPERYVRAIVPVLPGQILALLSGTQRTSVGLFDGSSWYAMTLPASAGIDDDERVVGLVGGDEGTFLVTSHHVFLVAPTGVGVSFVGTDSSNANVRSFRPTITDVAGATPPPPVSASEVLVAPQPIDVPGARSASVPALVARELPFGLVDMTRAVSGEGRVYAALASAGMIELRRGGDGPRYRSRSLVHASDLQLATGEGREIWARGADGDVGRMEGGRLRRLPLPDEVAPQAIATGRIGAYLVVLVRGTSAMRVYTSTREGFRMLAERTLEVTPTALPFASVSGERVWVGLEIARESGDGVRMRGAAVIDPSSDAVVYHHRGASHEAGGLPLPDEVSGMTFDADGNAWFATLSGAVRVEEHQAIVFDETRGVRGDVVTDVAAGAGHMWIAAAEGLGSYADRRFDFVHPEVVMSHRPVAVAIDDSGHLWAGGRYGLLHHDGTTWSHVPLASGDLPPGAASLPLSDIRDIEIDAQGRVWLLGPEEILVLAR